MESLKRPVGDRVTLRDVTDQDVAVFYEHQRDPDAVAMALVPVRDREAHLAHWRRIVADPACLVQTIVLDGEIAGNIGSWDEGHRRLVGYWIGRSFWGRGVATAALTRFLERDSHRPLMAYVAKRNAGSLRVLEKCGFVMAPDQPVGPAADGVEEALMMYEGPASD